MKIFVDADACPVIREIEEVAKESNVFVTLVCDTNHMLHSQYCTIRLVDDGPDSADIALINMCQKGDIMITQDYGLAALGLGKGVHVINQNGWLYNELNMDQLLMSRYIARKERWKQNRKKRKRSSNDDLKFKNFFQQFVINVKREANLDV